MSDDELLALCSAATREIAEHDGERHIGRPAYAVYVAAFSPDVVAGLIRRAQAGAEAYSLFMRLSYENGELRHGIGVLADELERQHLDAFGENLASNFPSALVTDLRSLLAPVEGEAISESDGRTDNLASKLSSTNEEGGK